MLKDPSLCKKKRRSSSLKRQLFVSANLPPSRSKTLPQAKIEAQDRLPASDDSLKQLINVGKPRRPAPTKPSAGPPKQTLVQVKLVSKPARQVPSGPVRSAPVATVPNKYGSKALPPSESLRTTGTWRADNTENLLAGSGNLELSGERGRTEEKGSGDGFSTEPGGRESSASRDVLAGKHRGHTPSATPPTRDENEVAYSEDMQDDDIDESMFIGGNEALPSQEDDDFILEPPDDFSESSVDELDKPSPDLPPSRAQNKRYALGIQFHKPVVSDEELEGGPKSEERRPSQEEDSVPAHRMKTERESGKPKRPKRKKRESKDYSEPREEHSSKHRSKKKRKSSATNELLPMDMNFPEYEFDRGLDKIPVQSSKSTSKTTKPAANFESVDDHNISPHEPYDKQDVLASDDYSPPWLDEPVESQELSFEELDAYAEDDVTDDKPRVVYREDVAALIW